MSRYFNQIDIDSGNDLEHYGVQGMKWGIRKYQNADGTLTAEGYRRYGKNADKKNRKVLLGEAKSSGNTNRSKVISKMNSEYRSSKEYKATQNAKKHYDQLMNKYYEAEIDSNGDERKADLVSLEMDRWTQKKYTPVRIAAEKKVDSLISKYSDEYSGALLRDMGRSDTAAGRKYIKSLDIDRLRVTY